jgi:hypothetical protein
VKEKAYLAFRKTPNEPLEPGRASDILGRISN